MDIKNLNTFIHVAELGSFSKAGERLGYSQPTVSVQIRQLEEELGAQLFDRVGHAVRLTEKGRELVSTELVERAVLNAAGKGSEQLAAGMAAGAVDLSVLDSLYAGRQCFYGDFHCHSDSGGTSDGKTPLGEYLPRMKELGQCDPGGDHGEVLYWKS